MSEPDLVVRLRALMGGPQAGSQPMPPAAGTPTTLVPHRAGPPPLLALPPSTHNAAEAPTAVEIMRGSVPQTEGAQQRAVGIMRGSVPQTEGAQQRALADGGCAAEVAQPGEKVQSIICK